MQMQLNGHVKDRLLLDGIVSEATDGYAVHCALPEIDPLMRTGDVIVADSIDGHTLESGGAFKTVSNRGRAPGAMGTEHDVDHDDRSQTIIRLQP